MDNQHTIQLNTVVAQKEEMLTSDLGEETVMMSIEKGAYYGLDSIGSRIWVLIEMPRMVSSLCDTLLAEYDVESEMCQQHVLAFLNDLHAHEIIEIVDAAVE